MASDKDWQTIAAETQERLDASIPSEWRIPKDKLPAESVLDVTDFPANSGLFTKSELEITDSGATEIVDKIKAGTWIAEDVTRAFCKRAAVAHQLTKCLTVVMFSEAIESAKALDEHFKKTGKVVGPLHGLPVSLKDNMNIKGKPSSVGFVSWATKPAERDSTVVHMLREMGAIAYVKTNVPTAMMIAESVNNLYGRTVNPLNRNLTSGGSSGGESALIAFHGSPLGIGTDIGGSLRIPAACTGIFTLRPSYGRFPHFDASTGLAGQESVASVHGPMARSIPDLRLYAKNMIDAEPWLSDPKCLDLPWREPTLKSKLKLGVLRHDGMVMPTPPVKRALEEAVEKLKAAGHEVIEWDCKGHPQAIELLGKFFIADGGKSVEKIQSISGEPWRPEMEAYSKASELGVYDLWQLQRERTALSKVYLDRWTNCEGLDAILSPTTPYASVKHGQFKHIGYTGVWNLLDYSATSFPCGVTADKNIDNAPPDHKSFGEADARAQKDYDAEAVHGMPVSLQLIARRLQDEKVLAMTERICADLGV